MPGVCTVIGVGPGLGRAVAERFASGGYRSGLIARDLRRLDDIAASMRARGHKVASSAADASNPESLKDAIGNIEGRLGEPTSVLVYNVVAFTPGLPSQLSPEAIG